MTRTRILFAAGLLAAAAVSAQTPSGSVELWPEGKMPSVQTNQTYRPYLTWFTPAHRTSRAVLIVVSGGGYFGSCDGDFEVTPMRDYMVAKGLTVVTMRYRAPRPKDLAKHVTAWQDAQRTVRLVRAEAVRRGLDPENIGFTGCSAGGHLAMMVAVSSQTRAYEPVDEIDRLPCHVNWAIPVYPAYLLADGADCHNVRRGNDLAEPFVPELAFDAATPAMCLFHGDLDGWSAMGSVRTYHKLRTMGVPVELHVLARENHCFQANPRPGTTAANWKDIAWAFLTSIDAVTGHPLTWRKGWTNVIENVVAMTDAPAGAWRRHDWGGQVLTCDQAGVPLRLREPFGEMTLDFEYRVPRGAAASLVLAAAEGAAADAVTLPLASADPARWHRLTVMVRKGAMTLVRDGIEEGVPSAKLPARFAAAFRADRGFSLRNVRLFAAPAPRADAKPPVTWDLAKLGTAPEVFASEYPEKDGVKAIFYAGEPFEGKPTRVFAYLAVPKAEPGKKVPGIVLVHGGLGSAFRRWVRFWRDHGYAAISMDTCGAVSGNEFGNEQSKHRRHAWAGPAGWGGYDNVAKPVADQWMYHAVAAVIRANSLLRAQPGVDPDRIGLTGVSWGGVLTCIAGSVDPRFAFAAPVYGCGFLDDDSVMLRSARDSRDPAALGRFRRWAALFDPRHYLPGARVPFLWIDGSNDFAFPLPSVQKSVECVLTAHYRATRVRMPHAHSAFSEHPKELVDFADSCFGLGPRGAYPSVGVCELRDGRVRAECRAGADSVVRAELNVTEQTGVWQKREWKILPMALDGNRASAELPVGVRAWYVNFFTADDTCVSGELYGPDRLN